LFLTIKNVFLKGNTSTWKAIASSLVDQQSNTQNITEYEYTFSTL